MSQRQDQDGNNLKSIEILTVSGLNDSEYFYQQYDFDQKNILNSLGLDSNSANVSGICVHSLPPRPQKKIDQLIDPPLVNTNRELDICKLILDQELSLDQIKEIYTAPIGKEIYLAKTFIDDLYINCSLNKGFSPEHLAASLVKSLSKENMRLINSVINIDSLVKSVISDIKENKDYNANKLFFAHCSKKSLREVISHQNEPLPPEALKRIFSDIQKTKKNEESKPLVAVCYYRIYNKLKNAGFNDFPSIKPEQVSALSLSEINTLAKNLISGLGSQIPPEMLNYVHRLLTNSQHSLSTKESVDLTCAVLINNSKVPVNAKDSNYYAPVDWAIPLNFLQSVIIESNAKTGKVAQTAQTALKTICHIAGSPFSTVSTNDAVFSLAQVYRASTDSEILNQIATYLDLDLPFYLTTDLWPRLKRTEDYGATQYSSLSNGIHIPRLEFKNLYDTRLGLLKKYITDHGKDSLSFENLLVNNRLERVVDLRKQALSLNEQEAVIAVSKLASYYLTADLDQGSCEKLKRKSLLSLIKLADEEIAPSAAIAARVYLWKIYDSLFVDEKDPEVKKALNSFINECFGHFFTNSSKEDALLTLESLKHLLAESADYRILALLGSYSRDHQDQEVREIAGYALADLVRSGKIPMVKSILNEIAFSPDALGQKLAYSLISQPDYKKAYDLYCNEVIEPLISKLKEAAPDTAVYFFVNELESTLTNPLIGSKSVQVSTARLSDFESLFRFSKLGTLFVSFNSTTNKEGFQSVWHTFHKLNKDFEAKYDFTPLMIPGVKEEAKFVSFSNKPILPIMLKMDMKRGYYAYGMRFFKGENTRVDSAWIVKEAKATSPIPSRLEYLRSTDYFQLVNQTNKAAQELTKATVNLDQEDSDYIDSLTHYENSVFEMEAHSSSRELSFAQLNLHLSLEIDDRLKFHKSFCTCPNCSTSCPLEQEIDKLMANIHNNIGKIINALNRIEPEDVAYTEVVRAVELLLAIRNADDEHKKMYLDSFNKKPRNKVLSILPRNELVFSLVREVIIPSLVTKEVVALIPPIFEEQGVFREIKNYLGIGVSTNYQGAMRLAGNIEFAFKESKIVETQTSKKKELLKRFVSEEDFVTFNSIKSDTLIYSGSYREARKLQATVDSVKDNFCGPLQIEEPKSSFLTLGTSFGHNPAIISKTVSKEDLSIIADELVKNIIRNGGQYCTRISNIFIEGDEAREQELLRLLSKKMAKVTIGNFSTRSIGSVKIGPLNAATDKSWEDIKKFVLDNSDYLYRDQFSYPEVIPVGDGMVYPTIFSKPLAYGAEYRKPYAPLVTVQRFSDQYELMNEYFNQPEYLEHAMHVYFFGELNYKGECANEADQVLLHSIRSMKFERPDENNFYLSKVEDAYNLHGEDSIFLYSTLTSTGSDKGSTDFGGYGPGSTYAHYNGQYFAYPQFILAELCDPPTE